MKRMFAVALGMWIACASGAGVYKAEYNTLDLDDHPMIVTNVNFDGLAATGDVNRAIAAATNGIPRITESTENPGWAANADSAGSANYASAAALADSASYATEAGSASYAFSLEVGGTVRSGTDIANQLDAATATNAQQSAAITNCATKADATLTPVYSQTATFSDWTVRRNDEDVTSQIQQPYFSSGAWRATFVSGDTPNNVYVAAGEDATALSWNGMSAGEVTSYTATRVRTDIVGYVLGLQTNKVLAAAEFISAQLDALAETNAMQQIIISNLQAEIAAITNILSGLENALHIINTGTNIVTVGGN